MFYFLSFIQYENFQVNIDKISLCEMKDSNFVFSFRTQNVNEKVK